MRIFKQKIVATVCIIFFLSTNTAMAKVNSASKTTEDTLKVGFYEVNPYYFINDRGHIDGYYKEVWDLISDELDVKYEYVMADFADCIDKLESGEIDLLFGLHRTDERLRKLEYTDNYITVEMYGLYTNKNINYGELKKLDGGKIAFVKDDINSRWMKDFLKEKSISINQVITNSYDTSADLLESGKVDAMCSVAGDSDVKGKNIYEYSLGPVYICGNKNSIEYINKIDRLLDQYKEKKRNPIDDIQKKYRQENHGKNKHKNRYRLRILLSISILLILVMITIVLNKLTPLIIKKRTQNIIKNRMKNNEYLLYYQPIIDPKKNSIMGFEALLRLNDSKEGILPPNKFIKEIEDNDMIFDVSLWILKNAVNDYKIIREYKNVINKDFYISINVSLNEIENEKFIKKVKKIKQESGIGRNKICLEIVEKIRINDLFKMQQSIKSLKESGIMIAIDDFGVEYSNLDILEKLDCDMIKLDKYFIDDIERSMLRKEILDFLSNISIATNKTIVVEGVESADQKQIIQDNKNTRFYIQGYYYSKPVPIEEVKNIKL